MFSAWCGEQGLALMPAPAFVSDQPADSGRADRRRRSLAATRTRRPSDASARRKARRNAAGNGSAISLPVNGFLTITRSSFWASRSERDGVSMLADKNGRLRASRDRRSAAATGLTGNHLTTFSGPAESRFRPSPDPRPEPIRPSRQRRQPRAQTSGRRAPPGSGAAFGSHDSYC
jgi:hypothetical protein